MRLAHVFLSLPRALTLSFSESLNFAMGEKSAPEGTTGSKSSVEDPPFNERQLAWLSTAMTKGAPQSSQSSSKSGKSKRWLRDSWVDRRGAVSMPSLRNSSSPGRAHDLCLLICD